MIGFVLFGIFVVLALAYWNGANDVSKTIATIVGGRVTNYKKAVILGASFNAIGTFLALFFAQAIFKLFTKGILVETQITEAFAVSIILGAVLWIILATKVGMPVSTTHSIVGAIIFLGVYVFTLEGVLWKTVFLKIALPLMISPLVSFLFAFTVFWMFRKQIVSEVKKREPKQGLKFLSVDGAHWVSCAASSFARGMNDGPKFVALAATFLISTQIAQGSWWINVAIFSLVAVSMGLGGYIHGMKVTHTLSYKVTKMGHTDGFIANLVTSLLVTSGAYLGAPMSTTHVSSFAIIGIGSGKGLQSINWKTVKGMLLAWVVTIPVSGMLSIVSYSAVTSII